MITLAWDALTLFWSVMLHLLAAVGLVTLVALLALASDNAWLRSLPKPDPSLCWWNGWRKQ